MKELKFIHITKNAGTSIENIAFEKNINWGRYDTEYKLKTNQRNSWWHKVINKSPKYDWFLVVRNPYERLISEFYCKFNKIEKCIWSSIDKDKYTKEDFNNFIKNRIVNWKNFHGHYMPQSIHLQDDVKIHVLKYEKLENDFNDLMKIYNLDLILNKHDNKADIKKFTVNDFDTDTIKLINDIYYDDFEYFYPNEKILS